MKTTPVLILKPNGDVAIPMDAADLLPLAKTADLLPLAKTADLAGLAKDASLAIILAALELQPKAATRAVETTISLAGALGVAAVAMGGLAVVSSIRVKDLTGAVIPTMRLNGNGESPLALTKGELRENLAVTTIAISCAPGGGSLVLELMGR